MDNALLSHDISILETLTDPSMRYKRMCLPKKNSVLK